MAHLYALDCEVDSALASVQEKLENVDCSLAKVRTMVAAATMTENSGEKQYYLIEIAGLLGMDFSRMAIEPGTKPYPTPAIEKDFAKLWQ